MTQTNPTDAVAQARERLVLTFGGEGFTSLPEVEAELDALIAAVRAECADKVAELEYLLAEAVTGARETNRQMAGVRKKTEDLYKANWDLRKWLQMADAEIQRLRGATPDTR